MKQAKSPADMKALAALLACPHSWGPAREVRVMTDGKPDDGKIRTCTKCGTHQFRRPDNTGFMCSPDALSDRPPIA